jgi:hypothetical protein
MSVLDVMKQANLLDWHTLLVGLEHGWCDKEMLIDYAEAALGRATGEIDGDLVSIVSGESCSEDDIISIGLHFLEAHGQPLSQGKKVEATEKWRFAHISWLLQKEGSDEEKISELQEIYAQFGFPDDMASCSIYRNNGIDPLVAARNVIAKLSLRW